MRFLNHVLQHADRIFIYGAIYLYKQTITVLYNDILYSHQLVPKGRYLLLIHILSQGTSRMATLLLTGHLWWQEKGCTE